MTVGVKKLGNIHEWNAWKRGETNIVENIGVTLGHNSPNENNGPVFVRINVGLQFVFRIYRPNCPRLFLNGICNNFYNSRTCWANSLQSSQLYESSNIEIVTGVGDTSTEKVNTATMIWRMLRKHIMINFNTFSKKQSIVRVKAHLKRAADKWLVPLDVDLS